MTHQAVDRLLELPKGSTSYYFRTREALVDATVARIVERSRTSFADAVAEGKPAGVIAEYVDDLVTRRAVDLRARHALLTDSTLSTAATDTLARCLFSPDAAQRLMATLGSTGAEDDAQRLIATLEGIAFSYTFGLRRRPRKRRRGSVVEDIRASLVAAFPILEG